VFAAGALAMFPGAALWAQGAPRIRVGILVGGTVAGAKPFYDAFKDELSKFGWHEGANLELLVREGRGDNNRVAALAGDLVAQKPNLIVAATAPGAVALSKATSTIPIVFILVTDPVALGLAESLARPGKNATGTDVRFPGIRGKRMEFLAQAVPSIRRIAVIYDPSDAVDSDTLADFQRAAKDLAIEVRAYAAREPEQFRAAFAELKTAKMQAVAFGGSIGNFVHRKLIADLALDHAIPSVGTTSEFAEAGLLMSYDFNVPALYRTAARYVDRILRGARPNELAIEQPSVLELVLNVKTARKLGIRIPQSVLLRADRVIE